MGGLWGADGVLCAAAGFEIKAETPKSCHGEWQSSEQRSRVGTGGYKARVEEGKNSSTFQFRAWDNMSHTPVSPTITTPIANNVQMDVDSDSEAEQAAREFAQTQEQLRITNEAWERRWEEWKRKEEEEERQWIEAMEAAAKEVEEKLEREWQAQLQVSTGVLRNSSSTNFAAQRDLEVLVMMPEPLLAPFTDKGKEVSTGIVSGFDTGTEN